MKNVEGNLSNNITSLKKGTNSPLINKYRPECDVTVKLNETESSYYASLVGIMRWMVEMGRVDIACKVSMMSSYVSMKR